MMATDELCGISWRKSSYSAGDNGNCLEVADGVPDGLPVRDSKAAPAGPVVTFSAAAWAAFVGGVVKR
ncbi:DUF397 domain-containing protein [Streptomyces hainanensis]|uniref:DUF397 domain-containing protein n=2 Tax=Streptomyces hainanensis TaxID=402648 RepID=A0A4R4TKK9_9ACTN|nr:DUF397 domain-containing protein [Streptomyces hainanensis]